MPRDLRSPILYSDKTQRGFEPEALYTAIVFEFVEQGENDPRVMRKVVDFLWLVGFCFPSSLERNWESGVLLDHSDIVHPN